MRSALSFLSGMVSRILGEISKIELTHIKNQVQEKLTVEKEKFVSQLPSGDRHRIVALEKLDLEAVTLKEDFHHQIFEFKKVFEANRDKIIMKRLQMTLKMTLSLSKSEHKPMTIVTV